jgi:hypothetical protein
MTTINYIFAVAIILIGIAVLIHVAKNPRDAHGKNRK